MKTLYTCLLIALCFGEKLCAQTFQPIPESEATWIQASFLYYYGGHEHTTITNSISFSQDTLIGSEIYHTLKGHQIIQWADNWGQQNYTTETYTIPSSNFYFRQDIPNKKVYTFSDNQDTLLYDFNLTVGQIYPQTVTNVNYPNLLVMGQDSVLLLDGLYHKRWQLGTNSIDSAYISIIEGIGASSGFNLTLYPQFEQSSALMCLKVSENQVYDGWMNNSSMVPAKYSENCTKNVSLQDVVQANDVIKMWPNPCNDILIIYNYSESNLQKIRVSDVFGNIMIDVKTTSKEQKINLSNYEKGAYFIEITIDNHEKITKKIIVN